MLKARNRKLSMLLVLAMLMTMFAGIGTASAASITYSAVNVPVLQTDSSKVQTVDAQVLIDVSEAIVFNRTYESMVTLQLPSNVEIGKISMSGSTGMTMPATDTDSALVSKAGGNPYIAKKSSSVADIVIPASWAGTSDGKILLTFETLKIKSGSGDITANFLAPSGSPFPSAAVTIARIATSSGKVNILGGSIKNIGDAPAEIDTITLAEATAGVFKQNEVITLELSKGFEWVTRPTVAGGWAFDGRYDDNSSVTAPGMGAGTDFQVTIVNGSEHKLEVKILNNLPGGSAGRISVGTDLYNALTTPVGDFRFAEIQAKDEAKEGDVTVTVSTSNKSSFSKTKVVVAKYGSYDVTVSEGTTEEVLAGRDKEEIGEFYIEEVIAGSLIQGRTIIFDLPSGVKWANDGAAIPAPIITTDVKDGDVNIGSFEFVSGSKERSIKATVNGASGDASEILFKDAEVKVDPGFEGDIEVTVRGTASAEGTVKVAEAKLPVTIKAENVTKIITGAANQKVADIIIQESVDEAILDNAANDSNMIVVGLDEGYRFSTKPTVKVTDGDLEIDTTKLINDDKELKIVVKYSSNEASTITISDVAVTALRYVPEGNVKATLVAVEDYNTVNATGSTALVDWDSDKSAGSVVIATLVTPAEGAGAAEFRVGSNIYYVGGDAKVMDVVPYIKGDRTYVPMRYLGEMLGAEVVWDDAARTVTLTKGDTTVVFTIGSTSYTVNGEAKTADVAPEIANDRTMLPARFVAEAFGAVVGWDAGTQTVLIQQ